MYQRQSIQAFAPSRPAARLPLRIRNVRYRSSILPGNRQRAEEKGSNTMETNPAPEQMNNPPPNHQPVQHNQPNFSKTRQQRAAQISDEVRMLQRDQPAPTVRGSASSEPAIRSSNIDAEAIGRSPRDRSVLRGGQMGANDFSGREGPGNQSAGEPIRSIDDEGSLYQQDNNPDAEMDSAGGAAPSEGGEPLIDIDDIDEDEMEEIDTSQYALVQDGADGLPSEKRVQREAEFQDDDVEGLNLSHQHEQYLLEQFDKEEVTDVYFTPDEVSKEAFFNLGQGGATIVAGNGAGVIEDRLKLLGEPTQDGVRVPKHIRSRLRQGHVVSLESKHEMRTINKVGNKTQWAPLPAQFGTTLVDRMVRGQYADLGAKPHAQQVLNHIGMNTSRNGTYLAKDGDRFLKKVQSLLPAQSTAKPAQRAKARK